MDTVFEFNKDGSLRDFKSTADPSDQHKTNNANSQTCEEVSESSPTSQSKTRSLDECLAELDNLVGLESVKANVRSLTNLICVQKAREQSGSKQLPLSKHLVFTGNPGTGKTTVARLLAEIYKLIGALPSGQLVEVDRSSLVGGYIGQTAIKTNEVLNKAYGGVLFIDEAYSLTANRGENDYGFEAVDTLLKGMEDHRDELVVIVAGYTEPMQKFLNSNPGLKSRFNNFIDFPDYNADELFAIFSRQCTSNGFTLDEGASGMASDYFNRISTIKESNFANAREVRNYFEKTLINQANRIATSNLIGDRDNLFVIKAEDLPA